MIKKFYAWIKNENGKKVDVAKLTSELSKEEIKEKLKKQHLKFDGIDVINVLK